MRQIWPVILQALHIMLPIQGMQVISGLTGLSVHLMELMPCDTGSAVDNSWTGTCRSYAGTVELQRMAVVRGLSRTLLMPLFHKPD